MPRASRVDHEEVIAAIDDTIVRRLVRFFVHVRGYAPYYAATVAFGVMLLLVPLGGAGGNDGVDAAGDGAGREPAPGRSTAGADQLGLTAGTGVADGRPGPLRDGGIDTFAVDAPVSTSATGSDSSASTGTDSTPAPPTTPSSPPSGPSFGPPEDEDEPCTVRPGSPAPSVTPSREAEGAQNTAEAATGAEAPTRSEDAVDTATDTAGCPEEANDVVPPTPGVPLPV